MIEAKADLIRKTVVEQTGAAIALNAIPDGVQKGLELWFDDLTRNGGPLIVLRPAGLIRHHVTIRFGSYSASIIRQIGEATDEQVELARALVRTVGDSATLSFPAGMDVENWKIDTPKFMLKAERRVEGDRNSDEEVVETCRTVVAPIMAALAEVIGYEEDSAAGIGDASGALEGEVSVSTVRRRERNPRNRFLCLRLHGHECAVCGMDPRNTYGLTHDSLLEVHHLQPLSQLDEPRPYDPRIDLVPLCPNCHRVAHTRRPVPWSIAEVRDMMNG